MSSTLSIIQAGTKTMYTYSGTTDDMVAALTSIALRDKTFEEAVTRTASEINKKKQVDQDLISMTQN